MVWLAPGVGLQMMNPQDFATTTWLAKTNKLEFSVIELQIMDILNLDSGSTPVLLHYINVVCGWVAGPFSAVGIEQSVAKYNVGSSKALFSQLVRAATGEGTDWYGAIDKKMLH